jgi:ABC-type transport system involved in multi-copper enzyme maturation permease subunit
VGLKEASGGTAATPLRLRLWGRPKVGSEPMLWKEVFVEQGMHMSWLGRIIIGCLVMLSFIPAFLILYFFFFDPVGSPNTWRHLGEAMSVYVRIVATLVACLMLLAVAVRSSGCLSSERDRQTMDGLLTTPLDGATILFAKWAGCIASVRWGWVWLGTIWFLGIVTGGLHVASILLLIGAWLVYAGFFACLGMWFSLVCRTSLRATMWTLLTTVLLAGGHWIVMLMCCYAPIGILARSSGNDLEYVAKFQAGQTPPFVLGLFALHGEMEFRGHRALEEMMELVGFSVLGLGTWTVVGLALAAFVHHRFQDTTLRQAVRRPEFLTLSPVAHSAVARSPDRATGGPATAEAPLQTAEVVETLDVSEAIMVPMALPPDADTPPLRGAILLEDKREPPIQPSE